MLKKPVLRSDLPVRSGSENFVWKGKKISIKRDVVVLILLWMLVSQRKGMSSYDGFRLKKQEGEFQ